MVVGSGNADTSWPLCGTGGGGWRLVADRPTPASSWGIAQSDSALVRLLTSDCSIFGIAQSDSGIRIRGYGHRIRDFGYRDNQQGIGIHPQPDSPFDLGLVRGRSGVPHQGWQQQSPPLPRPTLDNRGALWRHGGGYHHSDQTAS